MTTAGHRQARSKSKAEAKAAEIVAAGVKASFYLADLQSPKEVVRAGKEIAAGEKSLSVAVLNAGIWDPAPERKVQADGLEVHYATNFLQVYQQQHHSTPGPQMHMCMVQSLAID